MIVTIDGVYATQNYAQDGVAEVYVQSRYFYPINRVLIEKDAYDQWTPISAEEGYAEFGYYEGSNNGGGQKVWTFYPTSWNPGMP